MVMMSIGSLLSGFLTWYFLPRLWKRLPHDRGKVLVENGMVSRGKPTGGGLIFTLLLLPVIALLVPFTVWEGGVLLALYVCMLCGFLDDASTVPWGELKKGLWDAVTAFGAAYCLYRAARGADGMVEIWMPFFKGIWKVSAFWYVLCGGVLIWVSTNATNCSDGVDGLAGTLSLGALITLAILLYLVIGYRPVAQYLLIRHNPDGARWAVFALITAGAIAGYLWYNAEPSKVLMGDAGSRFLGMLIGILVLVSGNPFLIFVAAPVLLVNGGTGLVKLTLLRFFKRLGFDVRPPTAMGEYADVKQYGFIKILHSIRFPLHDHFRKQKKWSNPMVLMRFMLIQAVLTPILFLFLVKIR
ncbi:MAG: phospho-N-acetylmuramoyl-pentapeptide-transferase [Kiritimatiellae bacterium]|nr:phospho-N-acetylmuramoyl-pentapeptide-transferase [Kiritimatiellia bacterium]